MATESDPPFHAHVYFTAETRDKAVDLRNRLLATRAPAPTPGVRFVGELREFKVGPHPLAQFEVHFDESWLARILPALRASGLTVLVHPLTHDDRADHTSLARWIGEPLDLDLSALDPPGVNQGFERFGERDMSTGCGDPNPIADASFRTAARRSRCVTGGAAIKVGSAIRAREMYMQVLWIRYCSVSAKCEKLAKFSAGEPPK
jgi:DOPA 4,5-dioxygenase